MVTQSGPCNSMFNLLLAAEFISRKMYTFSAIGIIFSQKFEVQSFSYEVLTTLEAQVHTQ